MEQAYILHSGSRRVLGGSARRLGEQRTAPHPAVELRYEQTLQHAERIYEQPPVSNEHVAPRRTAPHRTPHLTMPGKLLQYITKYYSCL